MSDLPSSAQTLSRGDDRLAVAAVLTSGRPSGSAFLISPTAGVTATHVVNGGLGSRTTLQLPGSAPIDATVTGWWPMNNPEVGTDVALLELDEPVTDAVLLELDTAEPEELLGAQVTLIQPSGSWSGPVRTIHTTVSVEPDGLLHDAIAIDVASDAGSSGAPIIRSDTGTVIGMVVARNDTTTYCVPAAHIRRLAADEPLPPPPPDAAAEPGTDATPVEAVQAWVPGYVSDTAEGRDQLGIAPHVNALAALVTSRSLAPPASIGLFGDWGSGKSFFMRQMRQRIDLLSDRARAAERAAPAGTPPATVSAYCSAVRQVTFNAWHYADTNLWASLATHIFDSLAAPGADADVGAPADPEEHERVTLQGTLQEREIERQMLASRVADLGAQETLLAAKHDRSVKALVTDALAVQDLGVLTTALKDTVGDDPSVAELRAQAEQLTATGREVRDVLTELRHGSDRSWVPVLAAIGGALLLAAAVLVITRVGPGPLVTLAPGAIIVLTAVGSALQSVLKTASAATRLMRKVDERRTEVLKPLTDERKRLERDLAVVDEEIRTLSERAKELEIGRRMERFLADRGASLDYRQHLGVIALARRDFEILAGLLSSAGRSPTTGPLDRVVLYIDDLDRCPPETVVKVLEAVHLLLALPLFVVVVAVDPRWLLRAVQRHYRTMLAPLDSDPQSGHGSATAMDYLEKIFQIPFALPRMQPAGFTQLITAALRPADGAATRDGATGAAPPAVATGEPVAAAAELPHAGEADAAPADAPPGDAVTAGAVPAAEEVAATEEVIDLRPRALLVEDGELELLAELGALIPTPRAAKRLANVYQLARVQVPASQLPAFVGTREAPGRCAPTMLLLAVLVGFPAQADDFLRRVAAAPAHTRVIALLPEEQDGHEDRLGRALRALLEPGAPWPGGAWSYQAEISRVARFSFRTSVLLRS